MKDALLAYEGVTHSHGSGGYQAHHRTDGHTWVDPKLAVGQASAIRGAMVRAWPEHTTAFDAGHQSLLADLRALDAALQEVTIRLKGTRLIASRPAYGYLAKRYGWAVVNQDLPTDEEPTAAEWAEVSRELSAFAGGVKVMLFVEEPLAGTSAKLAALGVRSVVFDPCEQPSSEGDYIARMQKNIEGLGSALVEAVTPHTATPSGGA
jgi:zinc transport system substrate-binding protein